MFVDSHCHLDFPELSTDIEGILDRMTHAAVDEALCVSVTMAGFPNVLALAERHDRLWASVGVHPDNPESAGPAAEPDADRLVRSVTIPGTSPSAKPDSTTTGRPATRPGSASASASTSARRGRAASR